MLVLAYMCTVWERVRAEDITQYAVDVLASGDGDLDAFEYYDMMRKLDAEACINDVLNQRRIYARMCIFNRVDTGVFKRSAMEFGMFSDARSPRPGVPTSVLSSSPWCDTMFPYMSSKPWRDQFTTPLRQDLANDPLSSAAACACACCLATGISAFKIGKARVLSSKQEGLGVRLEPVYTAAIKSIDENLEVVRWCACECVFVFMHVLCVRWDLYLVVCFYVLTWYLDPLTVVSCQKQH